MEVKNDTLVLNDRILYSESKVIGRGDEGTVFNYQDKYAVKIFTRYKTIEMHRRLERKMKKLEEMLQVQDPGAAFPLGLVSSDGKEVDGYYTKLIRSNGYIESFSDLKKLRSLSTIVELLKQGDQILRRLHQKGFALGDIKGNNILLDEMGNPIYVDVDNYKYKNHLFDLIPDRAGVIYSKFQGPLSYQDNDKIIYALMALQTITGNRDFSFQRDAIIIKRAVEELDTDEETKEILQEIFSPTTDKPYVGDVLEKIKR